MNVYSFTKHVYIPRISEEIRGMNFSQAFDHAELHNGDQLKLFFAGELEVEEFIILGDLVEAHEAGSGPG